MKFINLSIHFFLFLLFLFLQGKYEQAANYYKRAYEISQTNQTNIKSQELNYSSCEYAISLAHGLFTGEADSIAANSKNSLESVLFWKSERLQSFSKDERTFSMYETLENRQAEERKIRERRKSRMLEKAGLLVKNCLIVKTDLDSRGETPNSVAEDPKEDDTNK